MGLSVKHVLGVLEWSYVVTEKTFLSKIEFGSGWHPPTPRFGKTPDFLSDFFVEPSLTFRK